MARSSVKTHVVVGREEFCTWLSRGSPCNLAQERLVSGQIGCIAYKPAFLDDQCFSVADEFSNLGCRSECLKELALRQQDFYVVAFRLGNIPDKRLDLF